MKRDGEVFVGIDTAKLRNAVAVAEAGRNGEIRYLGEFDNTAEAVAKLARKLSERYEAIVQLGTISSSAASSRSIRSAALRIAFSISWKASHCAGCEKLSSSSQRRCRPRHVALPS